MGVIVVPRGNLVKCTAKDRPDHHAMSEQSKVLFEENSGGVTVEGRSRYCPLCLLATLTLFARASVRSSAGLGSDRQ
jgi:hypothetical protein